MPDLLPHNALIVLGAAGEHVPLYLEARRRGVPTIGVDMDPASPARPLADAFVPVSTRDADAIAGALGDIRPAGVVCGATDAALPAWHALTARYGTPHVYPASALTGLDKAGFHEVAQSAGVPGYGFVESDDPGEVAAKASAELRFPIVVKPSDGSGSKGVVHVTRPADLPAAIARARSFSRSGGVLAEEFVQGRPLVIECFMAGGRMCLCAVQEVEVVPGTFVIGRMRCPALLSPETFARLEATAERLCLALGIVDGPADFDVILPPDGQPRVIEANPRMGGDSIPHLLAAAYGVDIVRALVALALGKPFDLVPTRAAHAAVELIGSPSDTVGELVAFEGAAQARAVPGITRLDLYAQPGDVVKPHDQSGHKIGAIVAAGRTARDADASLAAARALLRPIVEPIVEPIGSPARKATA